MPYPTITYDAATGSDTNPTGKDASGTNGDITDGSMGADAVTDGGFATGYGFEAVTNGDFATDTDWTKSAGATISGGVCRITSDGAYEYITQAGHSGTEGKVVEVSVDVTDVTSGSLKYQFDGGSQVSIPASVGTHVLTFVNDGNTGRLYIARSGGVTDVTIDNVSVREVVGAGPELVNNGTFGYGITGWTDISEPSGSSQWDGVGQLELLNPAGLGTEEGKVWQEVTVEIGKKYRIKAEKAGGASEISAGTFHGQTQYYQGGDNTNDIDVVVEATTTSIYLTLRNWSVPSALIDNVSVTEVLDAEWGQSAGASTVGGACRILTTAAEYQYVRQDGYAATQGNVVEITVEVTSYTSGGLSARFDGDPGIYPIPTTIGTNSIAVVNNGTNGWLTLHRDGVTDITFDNVSVREVTGFGAEQVTNGDFATGITGWTDNSNSPGASQWDGVGKLELTNPEGSTAEQGASYQNMTVVTGKTYRVQVGRSGGNSIVTIGNVSSGDQYLNSSHGITDIDIVIVATTTVLSIRARNYNDITPALIDNVTVKEVRSAPTLTFNETVDCTGVANDGGSDYVWIDTPTNGRRLFTVTSFLPSVAACTSIRTLESPTVDATGDSWAINGTRQTLDSNTSIPDPRDWGPGWNIEFASGTYPTVQMYVGYTHTVTSGWVVGDAPITMGPTADATTRPVIELTTDSYLLLAPNQGKLKIRGLRLGYGSGTSGSTTYIYVQYTNTSLWLDDCVVVPHPTAESTMNTGQANIYATNCHFTAAGTYGVDLTANSGGSRMRNCVIDGAGGTLASSAAILLAGNYAAVSVMNCLVTGSAGAGISIRNETGINLVEVAGCTIVDNAGDGITTSGTAITHRSAANIYNNLIAYNGGYGVTDTVTDSVIVWNCDNNAVYANGNGAYNGKPVAGPRAITLTADPFTSRATGDYTLNNTAGGGALLRAASYPASMPDGS